MRAVEQLTPGQPAAYYIIADQGWLDTAIARKASILRGVRENLDTVGAAVVQRFTSAGEPLVFIVKRTTRVGR